MSLGSTHSLREMDIRNISSGESKIGRCIMLKTLAPSRIDCLEIWEHQILGKFRATPGFTNNDLLYIFTS